MEIETDGDVGVSLLSGM